MKLKRSEIIDKLHEHIFEKYVRDGEAIYDCAVFDSREVVDDIIFIAIDGEKSAGVIYVQDAINAGAKCVVANIKYLQQMQKMIDDNKATVDFLLVDDSLLFYGLLSQLARSKYKKPVIGIIGSVGKTTTKNMLREIGGGQQIAHASRGSYNNQTGVPLTLCSIPENSTRAIVELGESHFGDLKYITEFALPSTLIITNVAQAHIEFLNDLEGVAKTMNESVVLMEPEGHIVTPVCLYNKDIVLENNVANLVFVVDESSGETIDENYPDAKFVTISNVEQLHDLTHNFEMKYEDIELKLHVPLIGRHFVTNAALAVVASIIEGQDINNIAKNLENVEPQSSRMRKIETDKLTIIDDCYNANPASMKASMDAIVAISDVTSQRSVFVMGPMRELGPNSDELHRTIGDYCAEIGIDVLICVGEATKAASEKGIHSNSYFFETVQACIDDIESIVKEGDLVGVKASRGGDPIEPAMMPIVRYLTDLK